MTNEERDTLIAQGWTPPVAVDPDWAEARKYTKSLLGTQFEILSIKKAEDHFFSAIKRGRELERAEAKPGMVWVKHNGSEACPVSVAEEVLIQYNGGQRSHKVMASLISWGNVTHYAIITQLEEK